MKGITELGYIRIGTPNLDEWRDYATKLLGMELRDDMDDGKLWLRMDYWHHRICIEAGESNDVTAIGLRVAGREEFAEIQATLANANIEFQVATLEMAMERQVLEYITLQDPAGNPLEIFHGPKLDPHLPFYPARRRFGKFVTGEAGLGHVIVRDNDAIVAHDFYSLLGFRSASHFRVPTPNGLVSGMFMHCNHPGAREHTIAFGMEREHVINHLMIEVDTFDDVMHTYQLIKAAGYDIMIDLGRHANDQAFSFYCKSPSGFLFEVAYCGPESKISNQTFILREDYYGHEPNPDKPAHMGDVDEMRK